MLDGARAPATLRHYRAPFLKLALWLALRDFPVSPPRPDDVAAYLGMLVGNRG